MFKQNNFLTQNVDIRWKTFVRESCDTSPTTLQKKDYCLSFQGNQAKETYEEIVNEKSDVNLQFQYKHYKPRSFVAQKTMSKPISSSEKINNNQIPEEKIKINTILKAVEQKDFKFLSKHVTRENVNSTDDFGWTPLMSAAYCGHLDIIEFLLNLGANRKAREKSGLTAAQLALKKNYLIIVALLKKKTESISNKTLSEIDTHMSKPNTNTAMQKRSELMEPLKDCNKTTYKDIYRTKNCSNESTGFYCETCKVNFYETTWEKHETSTLHIFNSKPKLSNTMYGISKQNKGYQMLLNTGWDEECGLGPSGKGIKYPIKTCLKVDRKGLGQPSEKEYRVTHFKSGDIAAVGDLKIPRQKCLRKKDREKLLNREVRKDRALRIALS